MEKLTREEFIPQVFEEISQKLTPEFSKEDWLKLWERANKGDITSCELFGVLWESKVNPYLRPEFRLERFASEDEL